MKKFYAILAVMVFSGGASMTPARAAPPTVTPTPGYDARLQEQRAALHGPVVPSRPVTRRRVKHTAH
jgi:hypothetical protein